MIRNHPPHATLVKFGYPRNLLHEGSHWAVLVRPAQPTLGSLVLCALGEAMAYADLPREAFIEQGELVTRIERSLRLFSRYERINYLMLMMVDPHVHFHVLPRYAGERQFEQQTFPDKGWPALPDLGNTQTATDDLIHALRDTWRLAIKIEGGN
ncbi:HIT family protein [Sphingomonas glaciei]|uniref:HIT family protein n=1 Tax=Sphingomonas glaciei TaxID=2938948 RepID=A0ABY5MVV5_9SPHN|nr:HIT family protein [Sphingomonas glaciei]UUR08577.1 HIT family protein [Sphingomonas glaciei]